MRNIEARVSIHFDLYDIAIRKKFAVSRVVTEEPFHNQQVIGSVWETIDTGIIGTTLFRDIFIRNIGSEELRLGYTGLTSIPSLLPNEFVLISWKGDNTDELTLMAGTGIATSVEVLL